MAATEAGSLVTAVLTAILALILVPVAIGLAYLYFLLLAGGRRAVWFGVPAAQPLRLAIALPAHNEEGVIGASVRRLLQADYPPEAFDVHVVADYCSDSTAAAARDAGAIVHERSEGPRGRKGYALGWLFQRLLDDRRAYDAIVVFDADSRVDPAFLQHASAALRSGSRVIQGRHVISNPDASTFSALADADMRLNNRIRNQAKSNLGLSARLMGDAMVFHRSVLEEHPWLAASSLAEDREYGIHWPARASVRSTPPWPWRGPGHDGLEGRRSPAPALVRRRVRAAAPLRGPAPGRGGAPREPGRARPGAGPPAAALLHPRDPGRARDGDLSRVGAGGPGALAPGRGCGRPAAPGGRVSADRPGGRARARERIPGAPARPRVRALAGRHRAARGAPPRQRAVDSDAAHRGQGGTMTPDPLRVLVIFGTRPEAIKMAPVIQALAARPADVSVRTCATAQHREMLDQVMALFDITPDIDLNLMQPGQTLSGLAARVLTALDPVLVAERPDWILVQGDTTTVMMAALAAQHRQVRVGHVEAGLRTWDRRNPFPEEMNRVVADHVSDLCFTPTDAARDNLLAEGIRPEVVRVTGNTVIDALLQIAGRDWQPDENSPLAQLPPDRDWLLVTAHRRENHGAPLEGICEALRTLARERGDRLHIVYPVHRNPLVWDPVHAALGGCAGITLLPPVDYQELIHLMKRCRLVLTDSGGLQEEAPSLHVPVLVLRETTERPEVLAAGATRLVGTDPQRIVRETGRLLDDPVAYAAMANVPNPYGDGHAAEHIAGALIEAGNRSG